MDVAVHMSDIPDSGALQTEKMVIDPLVVLADDLKARLWQQMVDVGDTASHAVLDRDHRQGGPTLVDGDERVLERAARECVHFGPDRAAGKI
jgi:hypothetical protein